MAEVVSFEERHLRLIEIVAEVFAASGRWPKYAYVEAVLDHKHGLNYDDVIVDLPARTVWSPSGVGPQSEVIAGVPALAAIPALADDLQRFLAVVAMLAARELEYTPAVDAPRELSVSGADVLAAGGIDAGDRLAVTKLHALIDAEFIVSFSGGIEAEWSLAVDRRVRPFRGVQSIDEYCARRWTPPTYQPAAAAELAPSILIVMPFEHEWSNNVHDMIELACGEVAATVADLRWQRADGISEPGRITDQIVNAILNAALIVADVTGYNPNVMFELGFADAAGKPIVVLNQNLDENPFDIKDWRAIVYDPARLADARTELVSFIRGGLVAARRGA
jgi:hypothetical protein